MKKKKKEIKGGRNKELRGRWNKRRSSLRGVPNKKIIIRREKEEQSGASRREFFHKLLSAYRDFHISFQYQGFQIDLAKYAEIYSKLASCVKQPLSSWSFHDQSTRPVCVIHNQVHNQPQQWRCRLSSNFRFHPRSRHRKHLISPADTWCSKPNPPVLNSLFHLQAIRIPARKLSRRQRMVVVNIIEENQESSEPESTSAQQTLSGSEEQ